LWLLAANLVGVWLAVVLIWPELGMGMGEFTYGRWMPLHMDWQLYGWCSLPLVGLLMALFFESDSAMDAHVGFFGWSFALAFGGAMSLCGFVSGKLFLNFDGWARIAFPTAQLLLWAVLAAAGYARWQRIIKFDTKQWLLLGLLVLLFVSPISLLWASGADVYPPIDPDSGGATGHSLLASSLGIIFIFGLLPRLLRLKMKTCAKVWTRRYVVAYMLSIGAWSLLDHGNASNTQIGQVLGLCVLLIWVPILRAYYRSFEWPVLMQPWLRAFFFWWGFLTVSGCISFLPGVLDVMKFTNGLVAHAHLAMAGMLGAFNMLILGSLGRVAARDPWADRFGFWCWQVGTFIYVVAMLMQGVREGLDPTVLFGVNRVTTIFYSVRLLAGALLVLANLRWVYLLDGVRGGRAEG
jgi:cytochrome c oxidase cbb3-type subunit 1